MGDYASCAICGHITRCTTECGGGGWADSCERPDGTLDEELRASLCSREWRRAAVRRGEWVALAKTARHSEDGE